MHRNLLTVAVVAFALPGAALADPGTWTTDAAVGPSKVDFTLELTCPAPGFTCSLIDGYVDVQTSTVMGSGTLDLDLDGDTFQVDTDSTQDVGSGPQPAYLTMSGTDMTFALIPFAGVPELTNVLIFALSNPPIPTTGLELQAGDYPFSETVSYSGLADVIGDLEFILPDGIVIAPDDVTVSGVFRVLGDPDFDDFIEYELRDVTASFSLQNFTTIGGEPVTVDITADLTANLSGETPAPPSPPVQVPALSPLAVGLLAALLLGTGVGHRRLPA